MANVQEKSLCVLAYVEKNMAQFRVNRLWRYMMGANKTQSGVFVLPYTFPLWYFAVINKYIQNFNHLPVLNVQKVTIHKKKIIEYLINETLFLFDFFVKKLLQIFYKKNKISSNF